MPRRVDEPMKGMHIRIPSAMRSRIKERAKKWGESESVIVREMIKKFLETA